MRDKTLVGWCKLVGQRCYGIGLFLTVDKYLVSVG